MTTRTSTNLEMIRSGLNLIQQALSIYDEDLTLAVSNRRFQEMFGLPDWCVAPKAPFDETIRYLAETGEYGEVADVPEFVQQKIDQALAFEPHYVERQRSNGRWISIEGSPLQQGGWVTVYTDITDIKEQEALLSSHSAKLSDQLLRRSNQLTQTNRELAATVKALEEAKRQLTDSEARTRMTTEMTPAHIAHVGRDQVYTYSNRRLSEVISQRPMNIVGLTMKKALGAEAYAKIEPSLEQAFRGEPSVYEFDLENGARRIRVAFTPDTGPSNEVLGAYVLSMDVTQEAQARAVILQTRKRELAAQLANGLAHDFSNLLTIILGLQSQMERMDGLPQDAMDAISTTKSAAMRGGVLLDRLSDISGRRSLSMSAVLVDELFDNVRALTGTTLPEDVTVSFVNRAIKDRILIDHGFIQDALINLILNARDAIDGPGHIDITASKRGETWLEIQVSDTGSGFSEIALERGLDPFFTTKDGDGSGLGLTMIYDFAQLSGGRIRIENTKQGALVTVQLPLRIVRGDLAPGMVLLVEDTEEIRTSVRAMLRDNGHTVLEADSAEEALGLAQVPGVTHIISDIMLSGEMTGLDLVSKLRELGVDLPVTMMTGLPKSDPVRQEAEARYPLLPKPFSVAQLRAIFEVTDP